MGQITFDHQTVHQTCDHCYKEFAVSRGAIYEDGQGKGIYLAALHACQSEKLVHLAIAIRNETQEQLVITLRVWPTETEFQMAITDASLSPWQNETYLGRIMDREEALKNSHLDTFFHIAEHLVRENPEIKRYLSDTI